MKKNLIRKETGFTLVELLATILIVSIVLGIVGYYTLQMINNSKKESQQLAYNNYKTSARLYVKENPTEITWKKKAGTEYYTCVSLNLLVEKNLLERKVLENEENPEYIIVTKDTNGNLLYEKFDDSTCDPNNRTIEIPTSKKYCNSLTYTGEEQIIINEENLDEYVTFEKEESPKGTEVGDYKVSLKLKDEFITPEDKNEKWFWKDGSQTPKTVTCKINKKNSELSLNSDDNANIIQNENNDVYQLTYTQSGEYTITLNSDIPGTITAKSSNNDYVTVSNTKTEDNGTGRITGNATFNILSSRGTNTYITFTLYPENSNYNVDSIILLINYENDTPEVPNPDEEDTPNEPEETVPNDVCIINFIADDESVTSNAGYFTNHADATTYQFKLSANAKNMWNATSGGWFSAIKTGHHPATDAEWIRISDNKTYNQDNNYTAKDFCPNLSENSGPQYVTLKVNWTKNICTIKFSPNGGVFNSNASNTTQTVLYEASITNMRNATGSGTYNATKTGHYTISETEWIRTSDSKTFNQAAGYSATNLCPNLANSNQTVTLKVNWKPYVCTIKFSPNGGVFNSNADKTTQKMNYGTTKNMWDAKGRYYNATKSGSSITTGKEWFRTSDNKIINQANNYTAITLCPKLATQNQTITLKVNWCSKSNPTACPILYLCKSASPDSYEIDSIWMHAAPNYSEENSVTLKTASSVYKISTSGNFTYIYAPEKTLSSEKIANYYYPTGRYGYIHTGCLSTTKPSSSSFCTYTTCKG